MTENWITRDKSLENRAGEGRLQCFPDLEKCSVKKGRQSE